MCIDESASHKWQVQIITLEAIQNVISRLRCVTERHMDSATIYSILQHCTSCRGESRSPSRHPRRDIFCAPAGGVICSKFLGEALDMGLRVW